MCYFRFSLLLGMGRGEPLKEKRPIGKRLISSCSSLPPKVYPSFYPAGQITFLFFLHLVLIYLDFIFLGAYYCCHFLWLYQVPLKGKGEQKDPNREIFQKVNQLLLLLSAVSENDQEKHKGIRERVPSIKICH